MELLERAAAFDALDGCLADARAGRGRLVLIAGEAGVGKTSLVGEFVNRPAVGAAVLWGACDALTTPRPLGPLADMAAALGGRVEELLRDEAPRAVLFPHVLARLRSGRRPSILVIEDLHWADEATLDLLTFLTRRIDPVGVLVLGTYRDEVGPSGALLRFRGAVAGAATVRRLRIDPLSARAVAALVAAGPAGPTGVDPARLHATTGGNPFYVSEVLASGGQSIPVTVLDAVLARAAVLSGPARRVLDAAAVLTPPAEATLLVEMVEMFGGVTDRPDGAAAFLDECVAAGMLRERDGGVAFRHELARLAVERALPPGRRSELHQRALAALLARAPTTRDPARLAHHAEGAGDAAAVLAHAPAAARRAAALGAHREAAEQYARALRHADALPPAARAPLLEAHSYECYLTDQVDDAIASRRRALECGRAAGDRRREGDSLRWLSRLTWFRGDNAEAERAGWAAVELLEALPPGPELAMAYSNLAQLRMLAGDVAATIHWGDRAIELARRFDRTDIVAHALNNMGTARSMVDPPAGLAMLADSLAMARAHNLEEHVARAYTNLGSRNVELRDYAEADRWLTAGIAYCTERDLDSWRLYMLGWTARSDLEQGRWSAATGGADLILRDARTAAVTRIAGLVVLGLVRARRGDPEVWPALDEALALAAETGESQRLGPVAAARAEAAWLEGDPGRARELIERTIELVNESERSGAGWQIGELAFWYRRSGGSTPVSGKIAEPFARQLAGDWAAAAARWRELGCPYESACAAAESDDEDVLRSALVQLQRLGAGPAAAAVRRRLRALGVRGVKRGPRAATKANAVNLTPREMEVLALVMEGLRNTDIATRLFISGKTVDHHVSAILTKLGVRSRGEAASAAARLGIEP